MGGGGARAAYQVGVLRGLARHRPDFSIQILTGVSAGAINTAHLANHLGTMRQAVEELAGLWERLRMEDVFRVDPASLGLTGVRWLGQLLSGGRGRSSRVQGLVDTQPLREFLTEATFAVDGEFRGIRANLERGRLRAVALSASSYTTGQSITWVQGRNIREWERPMRRARQTELTVDHVMASAALPLFFPAVQVGDQWFGDGGIRLTAPLSPAVHLGASRILAISTRYEPGRVEADQPAVRGYPPPAQVAGVLMNAVFLDLLDQDALRMERLNHLLRHVPPESRDGLRPVELLILRPSTDLGKLANQFEPRIPRTIRFLSRGLGTRPSRGSDFLSLILFQPDYLTALIQQGEADAEARMDEILAFVDRGEEGVGLRPGAGEEGDGRGTDDPPT